MSRPALAALLLALTACGGGDSVAPATSTPATPAPSGPGATGTLGPTPTTSVEARHGSAEVTYRGVRYAWPERACESTRGLDGKAVGWMATFQDVTEQTGEHRIGVTESRRYVQLRVRGYTGAGSYPSERVSVRLVDHGPGPALQTGFGTPGQALTLTEGGREGTYRSKDLTVRIDCDPADETSTDTGPLAAEAPEPGTAYVVRPEGAAFRFDRVRCGPAGGGTEVVAGRYPHFFRLRTGGKGGAGSGRLLLGVHGVVIPFDVRVTLDGDPAATGTFRSRAGEGDGAGETRGAFACG